MIVAGLAAVRWKTLSFKWPLALPLGWLGWQFIAGTQTVSPKLTHLTLEHFSTCVILFYLGCFGLKDVRNPWPLWTGLALALCWVMRMGLDQHFGGLEATRRFLAQMKDGADVPPGTLNDPVFLKRIASSRIFSTFSNADALAGGIELLLPVTLVFLWQITPKVRTAMRWLFVAILGGAGLACLYWSGSKAGWLVTLIIAMVALGHSTLAMKWKRILIWGVLILGVAAFGIRFAESFRNQNISVVSRSAYWQAALQITANHPVLGTGPGTFSVVYGAQLKAEQARQAVGDDGQIKRPDDDFARLCHNDYLEQACDSGLPGFLAYTALIAGYLSWLYRYRIRKNQGFSACFAVWLGLLGLCLHSAVEYHLYIPALAWPMFFLMGFDR